MKRTETEKYRILFPPAGRNCGKTGQSLLRKAGLWYNAGISLIRNNSVAISNCSAEGKPFGYSGDSPYAWKGSGGRWDEWLEFVLGSAPEDEETMTLTAELTYTTRTVRDTWEFRTPVSAIRAEE